VKLLIAEDDPFFRRILQQLLGSEFEVSIAVDGDMAWAMLEKNDDGPRLAILDWVMPGMTGPEICRLVRTTPHVASAYLILLTDKNSAADITAGLRAGADDYLTKPFDPGELRARVGMARRIVELQTDLATQVLALEDALQREKLLQTRVSLLRPSLLTGTLVTPATVVAKIGK
jgi:DNA-binding response OmpR family regulator